MDNNRQPQPKFDPETGRPLNPEQNPQPAPKFDPETGKPLTPPPVQNEAPQAQPQRLDDQPQPGYIPPQPQMQTQFNQQIPPQPAPTKANNGMAIGSLICGILSLVCCCCGSNWVPGVIAIVLAVLSKKDSPNGKIEGMALAGLICGIIGSAIGVISLIAGIFMNLTGYTEDIINEFWYQ